MRSEERLLIELLAHLVNPKNPITISYSSISWPSVFQIAQCHGSLGLLASIILKPNTSPFELTSEHRKTLARSLQEIELMNLYKMGHLKSIASVFDRCSIPYAPIKGAAFHSLIYKNFPYRSMADIDLMVNPNYRTEAQNCLKQEGFQLYPVSPNLWFDDVDGRLLGRRDFQKGNLSLDVHFDPRYFPDADTALTLPNGVFERARSDKELGAYGFCLDPLDQLRLTLWHSLDLLNPYRKVVILSDVALLMRLQNTHTNILLSEIPTSRRWEAELILSICERVHCGTFILSDLENRELEWLGSYYFMNNPGKMGRFSKLPFLSPTDKVLYLSGYLIPSPNYYQGKRSNTWPKHLYRASKVLARKLQTQ